VRHLPIARVGLRFGTYRGGRGVGRVRSTRHSGRLSIGIVTLHQPLRVSVLCTRRSDDSDARYSQGAQGIDMEHSETGSCQKAKEDGGQPGVRFPKGIVTGLRRPVA
jgi:hypothetical protein